MMGLVSAADDVEVDDDMIDDNDDDEVTVAELVRDSDFVDSGVFGLLEAAEERL